jgi:RNA polymerase sigma-70 factor, ECF subfamily
MFQAAQEKEWIRDWPGDKRRVMEKIYKAAFPWLRASAFRVLRDKDLAEDMVQEVMLRLWELERLDQITYLGAYLQRAVINRSLNKIREAGRLRDDSTLRQVPAPAEASGGDEEDILKARLSKAMESLPERCRLVFVFSRYEHLSNREIADLMEISIKTVENQMTKALRLLREELGR